MWDKLNTNEFDDWAFDPDTDRWPDVVSELHCWGVAVLVQVGVCGKCSPCGPNCERGKIVVLLTNPHSSDPELDVVGGYVVQGQLLEVAGMVMGTKSRKRRRV